jgi:hypothetical protein
MSSQENKLDVEEKEQGPSLYARLPFFNERGKCSPCNCAWICGT